MTFATTSSFLSSCGLLVPLFALVRAACFSVAVAPRQSAKSIVEDCQTLSPKRNKQLYQLCYLSRHSCATPGAKIDEIEHREFSTTA